MTALKNLCLPSLLFVLIFSIPVLAQSGFGFGKPFITNYSSNEYKGYSSNWSIVQDKRGVMYFGNGNDFGNGDGILEYDGVSWNQIPLPKKTTVRSLAISHEEDGKIYVGSVDDIGYLEADSIGKMQFVSLLDRMDEKDRNFGDVWETHATSHGIYFVSQNRMFRWANNHLDVWRPQKRLHISSVIRDTLYIRQWDVGLMRLEGDSLRLLPGGDQFADERIYVLLPYDENNILIGTRTQGFILYDGTSFKNFKTEVDDFLLQNQIYLPGCILNDGKFAFGTMRGGVVIIDRHGKLINHIDKSIGLQDNSVFFLHQDQQGALWLALNKGISKVEISSPLSFYDSSFGLEATVYSVVMHKGILYVTTGLGVYYLDHNTKKFNLVPGITSESWKLLSVGDKLLAATFTGVYEISKHQATLIRESVSYDYRAFTMHRSRQDPRRIYVGLENGFASLLLNEGRWVDEGIVKGINEQIHTIVETEQGNLWLGTNASGLLLLSYDSPTSRKNPIVKRYGIDHGLPAGGISAFLIEGTAFFGTNDGLYRYDINTGLFAKDSTFSEVFHSGSSGNYTLKEDSHGNVWINFGKESAVALRRASDTYRVVKTPFLRFANLPIYDIYPDKNGATWFGGPDGLIRYDSNIKKDYFVDFPVLIRNVFVDEDSLIFGGTFGYKENNPSNNILELDYASNALRIEFAAPSFQSEFENQFQTYLEGFDKNWSGWRKEAKKDYTNLPSGTYRFHVRAQNVYGHLSNEANFEFRILPPWYATWMAYIFYGIILVAGIIGVDRIQRRRLITKEREKSQLREAELRAEAAEARSKALQVENERKNNLELLSEIGKEITASLDFETIFFKLYEHVNRLVDASVFGVGIYHPEKEVIEYKLAIERGKRYEPYTRDARDKNQFPVWCIDNRKPVFINNVANEYSKYINEYKDESEELEDGSSSQDPISLIYLPLIAQEKILGVITIQSFEENAYTEQHLNIIQNLSAYTSIALDNADAYRKLNSSLEELQATQEKLVTQEKLASLGQLTAGIAHEIKNPLNFVNNFAELSVELLEELREYTDNYKDKMTEEEVKNLEEILSDLEQNAKKINEHGKRADSIIRSMLQHSRGKAGERQITDINAMLDEDLNLAYHGMRAQNSEFNIIIEKKFDTTAPNVDIVPQDISRVFLNIITNGFYEAHKKKMQNGSDFSPMLSVLTRNLGKHIEIRIRDNGNGIPVSIRDKLFEPFFTTKPTGQGTGLGLSLSYDIVVKEHKGELAFETEENEFTEFIVKLPRTVEA